MLVVHEQLKNGWLDVFLAFREHEIEKFITNLEDLKSGRINHFHIRRDDFSPNEGIADIEISLLRDEENDNMQVE